MRRSIPLVSLAAGLGIVVLPAAARASCTIDSQVATCSGDLSSGIDYQSISFLELNVSDLTANAGEILLFDDGSEGSGDGDGGGSATTYTVTFSDADYGIDGDVVVNAVNVGGDGKAGKDGGRTGQAGGDGGGGGGIGFVVDAATTLVSGKDTDGISLESIGGIGAQGGRSSDEVAESTHGGKGGAGGAGGLVSFTLGSNPPTLIDLEDSLVVVISEGGDGGDGGIGTSVDDAYGGEGGAGGNGGNVNFVLGSDTTLVAGVLVESTPAIQIESIGGLGGDGGEGDSSIAKSQGGDGGAGGNGGDVTVTVGALDVTGGADADLSPAVLVRSYGGAGGDGGKGVGGTSGSGGASAGGGAAGDITVSFGGTVSTAATDATGFLIQSIAGFAGNAGSSAALTTFGAGSESGGAGGDITATFDETIAVTTTGYAAPAIQLHSIGGGGGRAGSSEGIVSALGSSGSAGGDAGSATVTMTGGTITTSGKRSHGLHVTSIGGGGGVAGATDGVSAIGGSGGTGGDGGAVMLTLSGVTIATAGDHAEAVYGASIGNGGGWAHGTGGLVAVGASGGSGGDGSDVTLSLDDSTISTGGDDADAVNVHSVGGGGGKGSTASSISVEVSVAIGGSGGDGGNGGNVTIQNGSTDAAATTITTKGDRARGIVARSVGGGGGDGGGSATVSAGVGVDIAIGASGSGAPGGDGGRVDLDVLADITTAGTHAIGLLAHSTGGAGGTGGYDFSVSASAGADIAFTMGGDGGPGGLGGDVEVDSFGGSISTSGDLAAAIVASSVGGGGGNAGITVSAPSVSLGSAALTVGGSGGDGGDGGDITVVTESGSSLSTGGTRSHGIQALSVGGSGGDAGLTISATGASYGSLSLTVGGDGSMAGDGGTVSVTSGSTITVSGENAAGIRAQSIGGTGGDSGVTVSGDGISYGSMTLAFGGSGGDAGNGGDVSVTSTGAITTSGQNGTAILAHSVGQSGGTAEATVAASAASYGSLSASVEGNGGTGGSGGAVTVVNEGAIATSGLQAEGIAARSTAGGGGSTKASVAVTGLTMGNVSLAVGGGGGSGGKGGAVQVVNSASVTTANAQSPAILAQSLGGVGGTSGIVFTSSLDVGEYSGGASLSFGGSGGAGGKGGDVTIDNLGDIQTADYRSDGLKAQSQGGGGGDGGTAIGGALGASTGATVSFSVVHGGDGGAGGTGGATSVTNAGSIMTAGYYSRGIYAASIGGDGGSGGSSYSLVGDISTKNDYSFSFSIGGDGGGGAVGGDVSVVNQGAITTQSGGSSAIYAHSVGGNGGEGGSAASLIFDATTSSSNQPNVSLDVAVGGAGGTGADAGDVVVENMGVLDVAGTKSRGIHAAAIGGGGGDGGTASAMSIAVLQDPENTSRPNVALTVTLGGDGGGGGNGGEVTVVNTGAIKSSGTAGYGIFAHSVGGGGGSGGEGAIGIEAWTTNAYIDAIADWVADIDAVASDVLDREAILTTYEIAVGGTEGAQGHGGDLFIENTGVIATTGSSGTGISALTVGGGGGTGGDGAGSIITQFTVGRGGSGGGHGGDIVIDNAGSITTTGSGAMGIHAHSQGGGGGQAGDVEFGLASPWDDFSLGFGVFDQEDSGDGGDGGDIAIASAGLISTSGEAAHGIWAQSTGGAGGASGYKSGGVAITAGTLGSAGDTGNGGDITIDIEAPVTVSGKSAHGVFAQSVGGDDDSGSSGDITIDVDADITASGKEGRAILAQSDANVSAGASAGTITVTVADGVSVATASNGYETVGFLDGSADNALINYGTVSRPDGGSVTGYAVRAEGNALTIDNHGTLSGSVLLDDDYENTVNNEAGGVLEMGTTFDIGTSKASKLNNDGTISPGGADSIITSTFTGEFGTTDSGSYLMDVTFGISSGTAKSDAIVIVPPTRGEIAVGGVVEPNVTGLNLRRSGAKGTFQIFASDLEKNEGSFTTMPSVSDTATVDYTISFGTDGVSNGYIELGYTIDYTPSLLGGSANRDSFGRHLDGLIGTRIKALRALVRSGEAATLEDAAGQETALAFVDELTNYVLGVETVEALGAIYDSLAPGDIVIASDSSVFSSLRFADDLNSCPAVGEEGAAVFTENGACAFARISGVARRRDGNRTMASYDEDVFAMNVGAQFEVQPDWFVGGAIGYETATLSSGSTGGDATRIQGGVVVKREIGPATLSASLSGGYGDYTINRTLLTPAGPSRVTGDPDNLFAAGHLRASYTFSSEGTGFYARPMLDVGVDYVAQEAFTEVGDMTYALDVASTSATIFSANPKIEFGYAGNVLGFETGVSLSAGILALAGDTERGVDTRFTGAGGRGPTMHLSDDMNIVFADLGAAIEAQLARQITVEANFDTLLSAQQQEYAGGLRLNWQF